MLPGESVPSLLTLDDALALILERVSAVRSEQVPVTEALGRVLREPAVARTDLPPFASSAMDGFAVRAADTPGVLPVASRVAAGSPSSGPLPANSAVAIATGGVVPEGADAVVPVELLVDHGDRVEIPEKAVVGRHVRPRGGDVHQGEPVLETGTRIRAAHLGALSASGVSEVVCSARPRVAVLATGSELRAAGEALEPGQIYESNRTMIAAVLTTAGADVEGLPLVPDDASAHRATLERGLSADLLVSSGGVSMGPHDLVRSVARELGVEEVFWGVAVKPGKPLSFGVRGATLVFGLPGNPVSSLVGALVFVRTALLALQGAREPGPHYQPGRAGSGLPRNPLRDEFVRARRRIGDGAVVVEPVQGQDSHMIVRAASADALVRVPRGEGEIASGEAVRYLTLD